MREREKERSERYNVHERDLVLLPSDTSPGMLPSSPTQLRCRISLQPKGGRWSPLSTLTSRGMETTTYIRCAPYRKSGNFRYKNIFVVDGGYEN